MRRPGFSLLEWLVALLLFAVGVLALVGVVHRGARAERSRLEARVRRAEAAAAHERAAAASARWRAGVTLVELLIGLTLGGLLAMVAAATLHGPGAAARRSGQEQRTRRQQLEAASDLLVRELREGVDATAMDDSALALDRIIGSGVACAPDVVTALSSEAWRATPRAGDRWRVWQAGRWAAGTVAAAAATACPDGRPGWRASGVDAAPTHAVIVVTRRARWVAYRDADRRWQLGLREATATGWDIVQPAIGPFARLRLGWTPDPAGGVLTLADDAPGAAVTVRRLVHPRNR